MGRGGRGERLAAGGGRPRPDGAPEARVPGRAPWGMDEAGGMFARRCRSRPWFEGVFRGIVRFRLAIVVVYALVVPVAVWLATRIPSEGGSTG